MLTSELFGSIIEAVPTIGWRRETACPIRPPTGSLSRLPEPPAAVHRQLAEEAERVRTGA